MSVVRERSADPRVRPVRPDEIGPVSLEFVSRLALQTAYPEETGDETGVEIVSNAQTDFLEDHLGAGSRGSARRSATTPTEGLTGGDGDFRCGTYGSNGSQMSTPSSGSAEMPMGDRDGPH